MPPPKEPKDTPTSTAETAVEKPRSFEAKRQYFAHRRILHGDQVISKGAKVPLEIPEQSREHLWKEGDIAEEPPAPTIQTTAK